MLSLTFHGASGPLGSRSEEIGRESYCSPPVKGSSTCCRVRLSIYSVVTLDPEDMALTTPSLTLYVSNLETKTKKPELRANLYALFTPYGRV